MFEVRNEPNPIYEVSHTWMVPRKFICILFVIGTLMCFAALLVLSLGTKADFDVAMPLGLILVGFGSMLILMCIIFCIHAYFVIRKAVDSEAVRTPISRTPDRFTKVPKRSTSVPMVETNLALSTEMDGFIPRSKTTSSPFRHQNSLVPVGPGNAVPPSTDPYIYLTRHHQRNEKSRGLPDSSSSTSESDHGTYIIDDNGAGADIQLQPKTPPYSPKRHTRSERFRHLRTKYSTETSTDDEKVLVHNNNSAIEVDADDLTKPRLLKVKLPAIPPTSTSEESHDARKRTSVSHLEIGSLQVAEGHSPRRKQHSISPNPTSRTNPPVPPIRTRKSPQVNGQDLPPPPSYRNSHEYPSEPPILHNHNPHGSQSQPEEAQVKIYSKPLQRRAKRYQKRRERAASGGLQRKSFPSPRRLPKSLSMREHSEDCPLHNVTCQCSSCEEDEQVFRTWSDSNIYI